MQKAIAIDFDGTLCTNDYPNIGEPNWEIIAEAKMEQANGAGLILWTCREGEMLDAALKACEEWELHFDVVNESLPSWKKEYGNNPRKVGASEYWDDRSVRVRNGRFEHPENLSKPLKSSASKMQATAPATMLASASKSRSRTVMWKRAISCIRSVYTQS